MSPISRFVKDCIPPITLQFLQKFKGGNVRFEGNYPSWNEAATKCTGYDTRDILEKVLAATLTVKRGEAMFERDSVLFNDVQYVWPLLAGLLWAAARDGGRLNVLDFGGALGSIYFQNRKFFQSLLVVRWNVIEQVHYVEAGQSNIQDEQLHFYKTIADCLEQNQPSVILLSSVLQYIEDPSVIFSQLTKVGAKCLIIDRTPFSEYDDDKILIQRVPSSIYAATYPMRVFSYSKFMTMLGEDWRLVAPNLSPEGHVESTEGLKFSFQGMLLEASQ